METGQRRITIPVGHNQDSNAEQRLLARGKEGNRRTVVLVVWCSNVATSIGG
ncbi:hypothetical protein DPMN_046611 [Dreissena polymorpha]|uniref:Uncharacterized protein n=1 Tax=Dreissena polymorpha TaxID=45954 RepID=A0A9D4D680_DREPO|nr:hypothetical protein DPMN_046611 [Dreissena polymorpha]